MIKTAVTDYAADYDTDYERLIMSRYFDPKSLKIIITLQISDDLFKVIDHK